MTSLAALRTRFAMRPLLLTPQAARELVNHLAASDPRGMRTEGRFEAVLRKVGLARGPVEAMDQDDEARDAEAAEGRALERLAYAPLWAQQRYGEPSHKGFAWSLYDGVALMEVRTAISDRGEYFCGEWYHGYDTIKAALAEAVADSRVNGVFLRLCSPGGVVAGGLPELAAFMRDIRAAGGGKPIHVYADMACSAAYWIAAQADRITAPRVGLVGSIGAVLVHEEASGWLEKTGIKVTSIQFGAQKTAGNDWSALSAEAFADLQAEIDQCGHDFIADAVLGRPALTEQALLDTQARVYLANHADATRSGLQIGFVDALSHEEEAFQALQDSLPTPATAAKPGFTPSTAATTARGGPSASKETPMTAQAPKTTLTTAQATARRAALEAELAQIRADEAAAAAETPEGEAETPAADAEEAAETAAPAEEPADDEEEDQLAKEPAQTDAAAEREQILASAEAQAHPHIAMAAVRGGLTFAQFKGQVAAAAQTPRRGALHALLADTKRLGPDARSAEGGAATGESRLVAGARRLAEQRAKR